MLPIIITAAAVQFMPDSMPAHYNFEGKIDRWGSKYEKLIMPAFIIIMTSVWVLVISGMNKKAARQDILEKQKKEAASNANVMFYVAVAMTLFETAMQCALLYVDFQAVEKNASAFTADFYKISSVLIGIFITVIGNVVPKFKRNSLIGVRTKWSLEDDENWSATNRFGGGLLMIGGLLIITEGLILGGPASAIVALAILLACCGMCVLYSYLVYAKRKRAEQDGKQKNL